MYKIDQRYLPLHTSLLLFRYILFVIEPLLYPFQVDRLEDELMREQEKLKGITEELEQTFAEMSGY